MAAINDLISQIQDADLRERLHQEASKLTKQKKFGLVFEEHLPECIPLYDVPIKVGRKVMLRDNSTNKSLYVVAKIDGDNAICVEQDNYENTKSIPLNEVVCIAEFGESIFPYLKCVDVVCNAPDNDLWHALIEADNYHALQLLEYLYADKVDCIYIDPPYNTGARDWKYNNDYVDSGDVYRHSKWLSFMERRLALAKRLLNPETGVLIVTIDEHEVHRLRMLLDQIFPEFYIQMVTYVTSPSGASQGRFSRIEEYALYCFAKNAFVEAGDDPMIGEVETSTSVRWKSLLRSGPSSSRADRKNMFYPIYIDEKKEIVVDVGEPLPFEMEPDFSPVNGHPVVWPVRTDGTLGRWSVGADTFKELVDKGYVKLGRYDEKRNTYGITYISSQTQKMIESGEVVITGRDQKTGVVDVEYANSHAQAIRTVWYRTRHNAGSHGTNLISSIIGKERKFSFPKSVYATLDSIYSIVRSNKNALIIDFFAGSGTTMHAVNLMNCMDGGSRRCICVTNNEVSEVEKQDLISRGYQPGDKEWEKLGVARYITWPRTVCSIEGHDIDGVPLKGNYINSDRPMADGFATNAAFFKLGFLDKTAVALGLCFNEMLPVLWMKAGAIGPCPIMNDANFPNMLILPKNKFAVLINENVFSAFEEELAKHPEIQTVFLSTDYEVNYRSMVKNLNVANTYQLYRDYLDHFRLNRGRS